jgi:hypothetical protein
VQRAFQLASFGPSERSTYMRFMSPPHTALLYTPASLLPFPAFAALYALASFAALAFALRLLGLRGTPFLAVLGFYPVFDGICAGQNVFLTLLLLSAALRLWQTQRPYLAGVAAGAVAAWKPHLLAGIGLLWLLEARRDPRPLLGLVAAVAALAAIDLAFLRAATRTYVAWMTGVLGGEPLWARLRPGGVHRVLAADPGVAPARVRGGRAADAVGHAPRAPVRVDVAHPARRGAVARAPHERPRLLPIYGVVYVVSALAIRVARLEWSLLGWAIHPAVPTLAVATAIAVAAARQATDPVVVAGGWAASPSGDRAPRAPRAGTGACPSPPTIAPTAGARPRARAAAGRGDSRSIRPSSASAPRSR